jgi:hypothetical protein
MTSIIIKPIIFIITIILILLEFIFLLPIYVLSLIVNFIITLIWLFPSIYQLYLFIFTAKEYSLRIRIYLLLLSPIIIILYIPIIVICFIGYGIFLSLVNPLMTFTQRPDYPLNSLSLTVANAHLIYKYIKRDYYVDEFLIDTLILEKIKEVIHFVKKCWNFNSAKFLEKIGQTKTHNCELIFIILIHILDLSIISTIFFIICIPYIIYIVIIILIITTLASWCNTIGPPVLLFNRYRINSSYRKFFYFILLLLYTILFPFVFLLLFIILIIPYTFYYYFRMIRKFVYKIIELYLIDDGFCNVMNFFWVSIIFPFIYMNINIDSNYFIYVVCRINLRYDKHVAEKVRRLLDPFDPFDENMFDPFDPFNLLDLYFHHEDQ